MGNEVRHCSPAQAKAIYDRLPGRRSLAALRRELTRRNTPVSLTSLKKWRANAWTRKDAAAKPALIRDVREALERVGLPADALSALGDGDLIAHDIRGLLLNAALLLELIGHEAPRLIEDDPRGLAAICLAARRLAEGGCDLMREARALAERAMHERLALLLTPSR